MSRRRMRSGQSKEKEVDRGRACECSRRLGARVLLVEDSGERLRAPKGVVRAEGRGAHHCCPRRATRARGACDVSSAIESTDEIGPARRAKKTGARLTATEKAAKYAGAVRFLIRAAHPVRGGTARARTHVARPERTRTASAARDICERAANRGERPNDDAALNFSLF